MQRQQKFLAVQFGDSEIRIRPWWYFLQKLLGIGSSALLQVLKDLFKWVSVITTSKTLEIQFEFLLSTHLPSLLHNSRCGQASFLTIFQLKYCIWRTSIFQNISLALCWDAHSGILRVMPLCTSCPHCHASCQLSFLLSFSIGCLPYSAIYLYYLFISIFYLNAVTTWVAEDPVVNNLNTDDVLYYVWWWQSLLFGFVRKGTTSCLHC